MWAVFSSEAVLHLEQKSHQLAAAIGAFAPLDWTVSQLVVKF